MQPHWKDRKGSDLLTILIVDDSALVRHALRSSIEQNGSLSVCGEAENGRIGVEKVRQLQPDIVILDLQMPVMNGLEAARQISELAPNTTLLMFTQHCSEQLSRAAQAAGVQKVFSKNDGGPNQLIAWLSSAPVQP
jgi:DNA-binding NarL/FixJ family response regulator